MEDILSELECSIVLSSMGHGVVSVLSSSGADTYQRKDVAFPGCLGIGFTEDMMAIACDSDVVVLKRAKDFVVGNGPRATDSYWIPRVTYHTGAQAMHDVQFGTGDELWGVNTSYSCLCTLDAEMSFKPQWKPWFINQLRPEDRCHLNGLAMVEGQPAYVTALSSINKNWGWAQHKGKGGILMDVKANEFVLTGLPIPHSPRIINDELYVLLSGSGELVKVDAHKGSHEVVAELPGFVRGLAYHKGYFFVGMSRARHHFAFQKHKDVKWGRVAVVEEASGEIVAMEELEGIHEIYDVQVVPSARYPTILNAADYKSRGRNRQPLILGNMNGKTVDRAYRSKNSRSNDGQKDKAMTTTMRRIEGKEGPLSRSMLLTYDTKKLCFAKLFGKIFKIGRIEDLHYRILAEKRKKVGADAVLGYKDSRVLRDWLSKQVEQYGFYKYYNALTWYVLAPHFGGKISFAKRPRFRVHLAGGPGVSHWHNDPEITGRYDQITAWVPAMDCEGSNTLWIESDYGKGDYQPVNVKYGEILLFDGALNHGSVDNDTEVTRVGFDLRFAPMSGLEGSDMGIFSEREGRLIIPDNPQPQANPANKIRM